MKEFIIKYVSEQIDYSPTLISEFNKAYTCTSERYGNTPYDIRKGGSIYSVYSKESSMIIGFFTIDSYCDTGNYLSAQIFVSPSACKLAYIRVFNCMSSMFKKMNSGCHGYLLYSEIPTLGLSEHSLFEEVTMTSVDNDGPTLYLYTLPCRYKPMVNYVGEYDNLTVRV